MPRHRKIMSVVLMLALGLFGLLQLVQGRREFSETERRPLAERPQLSLSRWLSGEFARDSSKYLLDQVSGRDNWLSLKGETQYLAGQGDNGRVYFAAEDYFAELHQNLSLAKLKRNVGDMADFCRTYFHPSEQKPAAVLIAPTLAGVYPELLPALAPESAQSPLLAAIAAETQREGLLFPQVSERLAAAKASGHPLYFHTDHHWTQHGAKEAYEAWRLCTGKTSPEIDYKITVESTDFAGTTLAKGKRFFYTPDVIESYTAPALEQAQIYDASGKLLRQGIYDPAALKTYDQYTYFVGENRDILHIVTGRRDGGHLLIFKDSYANALVPFLCAHFAEITMVDLRYLSASMDEIMARGPYDELLFLYNVVTLAEDNNTFKLLK